MLFDFLPSTLHSMIKTLGPPNINFIDVKLYSWQLFNGLAHLESKRICHRDIKPQNILVDPFSGNLKIGDFGSAKVIKAGLESTSYQVTRFYRPPELLLEARVYGCNVDVWSAGCVLGEMLRGKVLFPGRDSKHQFQLLMETFGIPDENELYAMKAPVKIEGGSCEAKGLQRLLPYATPDCVEFLRKILVYRPKERLRGAQLLQDPFFEDLWVPGKVRKCGHLISEVLSPGDIDALKKPKRRSRRRTRSREQVGRTEGRSPWRDSRRPGRTARATEDRDTTRRTIFRSEAANKWIFVALLAMTHLASESHPRPCGLCALGIHLQLALY
ncbi:hypothetical protein L596_017931 [Steinernema carpocapsae]|uniref:Protein kinase domain-containing protein n=1 Tax=Steinernema carpocapsae TaxID=34508 RepID=A0A4V6A1V6_STECR|nr:hypothetical protein L596_017931 [Steinernema carpocapsae]